MTFVSIHFLYVKQATTWSFLILLDTLQSMVTATVTPINEYTQWEQN